MDTSHIFDVTVFCGTCLSCLWVGYAVALRVTGPATASVRLAAAVTIALWLPVAGFLGLAACGLFRPALALPLAFGAAASLLAGSHGRRRRVSAAADLRRACDAASELLRRPLVAAAAAAVGIAAAARVARALVTPCLGWDSLVYHLFKAGRWVEDGSWTTTAAPDSWGFYEYFSPFGSALWAWPMLGGSGDALVPLAELGVWCAVALGAYVLTLELGGKRQAAALAALALCATPALLNYLGSAYVDSLTLAGFVLGSVFLVRGARGGGERELPMAIAGLSLAAGTKLLGAPFLLLSLPIAAMALARRGVSRRARLAVVAWAAVPLALASLPYLRALAEKGSPAYPFGLRLGGWTLCAGNELLEAILAGTTSASGDATVLGFLGKLILPQLSPWSVHLNFGPAAVLVVPLAVLGLARVLRRPGSRAVALYLAACGLLALAALFSGDLRGQRTAFAETSGRLVTSSLAAAIVLAACAPGRWTSALLASMAASGALLALPMAWSAAEWNAVLAFAPWGIGAALAPLAAAVLLPPGRRGRPAACAAVAAAFLACSRAGTIEDQHRWEVYAAAARGEARDPSLLDQRWAALWPLWRHFDRGPGHRIALTAGWNAPHGWYRFPFLGSRLQNSVVYVPPTEDGGVPERRWGPGVVTDLSFPRWIERLTALHVDHVVVYPAGTVEGEWMRAAPRLFVPVAEAAGGEAQVFRFAPVTDVARVDG